MPGPSAITVSEESKLTGHSGYIHHPLSSISFFVPEFLEAQPVPWAEDLRKHDGEDVLCLPFSLSPFKISEAVRSMSLTEATVSKVFRFDPSTVEETMVCPQNAIRDHRN